MSTAATQPTTSALTFPCEVTVELKFTVTSQEDYNYLTTTDKEAGFIVDAVSFAEELNLNLQSINGVAV